MKKLSMTERLIECKALIYGLLIGMEGRKNVCGIQNLLNDITDELDGLIADVREMDECLG